MKKYKAAVIGCGRMGWLFDEDPLTKKPCSHAGAYHVMPNIELTTACDIDKSRLDGICKRYGIEKKYTDYKEMFRTEAIDILSICTHEHHQICIDAANTKRIKAIFCEKPLDSNLKNAEEMIYACRNNNVILTVDHTRRWVATFRRIKELIDNGIIGNIDTINGFCTVGWMNGGTHLFDILRYYVGNAELVEGFIVDDASCDPGGRAVIKFKNGTMCFVDGMGRSYVYFGVNFIGTNGTIRSNGLIRSKQGIEINTVFKSNYESGIFELEPVRTEFSEWKPPLVEALKEIVNNIETGKPTSCTGEDGMAAIEIALAIRESHNKGNIPVKLPLKNKTLTVKPRFTSFTKDGRLK